MMKMRLAAIIMASFVCGSICEHSPIDWTMLLLHFVVIGLFSMTFLDNLKPAGKEKP